MLDKLEQIAERYEELTNQLSSPELLSDPAAYAKAAKQHRSLGEVVEKYREWKSLKNEIAGARELLDLADDEEMRELARVEIDTLSARLEQTESDLKLLLIPTDPNDEKNVILEIRAGTGGDEATLFAAEMLRMYARYAERQGWRMEILDASESGIGGIKEAIALIEGEKVYSRLKHESGVHRVQRVPQTEASGRIHTSAITVAVLPEAEEVDVKIDPKDLRIDTFCSSGPGGQSVNTTYSAVRITHLPTNLVVSMQDEKSQIKNREKAMRVLRARLQELEEQKQHEAQASERRSMVGSGDRSEKIRTYNFKENRVSDHRIGLTIHQLNLVMEGDLDAIVKALITHYQAEKLKAEAIAA
ncbi:MAG: peptide chain release factor 1 [Acidobacteria bacterium 13_1_20CM_3_53_8]|nr:MAG: peptide chain release factor 1 [Acidobacteria bacterium 13_1_20CM_3_53_8]